MILAPLFGTALLVAVATGPIDDPMGLTHLTPREKSAATQPLVRSATDCIAHAVFADPRYHANDSAGLGNLIVELDAFLRGVSARHDRRLRSVLRGRIGRGLFHGALFGRTAEAGRGSRKESRRAITHRRTHKYICGARSRLQSQVAHNHKWRHADQCDGGGPMTSTTRILVGSTSTTLFSTMVYL